MYRLTKEQQEIVEQNHNLIYGVANFHNIDADEYYDVLAEGLCYAAATYDMAKGAFSSWAYLCMWHEYLSCMKSMACEKRISNATSVSLNDPILTDSSGATEEDYYSILASKDNFEEEVSLSIDFKRFYNTLTKKQKETTRLLMAGLRQKDLQKIYGTTRQAISHRIQTLKNKWKKYNECLDNS